MSTMSMQPHLTFDDFLAMERESELKHELIGGLVYTMAGVSQRHNDIVMNIVIEMGAAARASGCRARAADQLVKVDDINAKYPDFGVYCEEEGDSFFVTKPACSLRCCRQRRTSETRSPSLRRTADCRR
jgi:Uma2 family endonuclease